MQWHSKPHRFTRFVFIYPWDARSEVIEQPFMHGQGNVGYMPWNTMAPASIVFLHRMSISPNIQAIPAWSSSSERRNRMSSLHPSLTNVISRISQIVNKICIIFMVHVINPSIVSLKLYRGNNLLYPDYNNLNISHFTQSILSKNKHQNWTWLPVRSDEGKLTGKVHQITCRRHSVDRTASVGERIINGLGEKPASGLLNRKEVLFNWSMNKSEHKNSNYY